MDSSIITSRNKKYWFLLLYVVVLELIFHTIIVPEKTTREILVEHKELLEYPCCVPRLTNAIDAVRTNMVFLKSQTNASSIVFNILSRFSLNYNLDVFIPGIDDMKTLNNKYNVVFQFDNLDDNVHEYSYEDAYTVIILSHPISIFQSLYNDYRTKNARGTLRGFISESANNMNPVSTQLGLKKEDQFNETEIQNFIHEIERKFDYVMIYEHLDISLVLLSNLMGWPLEYVTNVFAEANIPAKYNLTEISKIKIMELNLADMMLYEYFLEKIENCAVQYGVSQLLEEMKILSSYFEKLKQHCSRYSQSEDYEPRLYWSCDDFNKTPEQFIEEMKERQISVIEHQKASDYLVIW